MNCWNAWDFLPSGTRWLKAFLWAGNRSWLFRSLFSMSRELSFWMNLRAGLTLLRAGQFWELIYQAADRGITVFVTTHYMDEAEYCNRISIMVDGQIKALDTPARLKQQFGADTMDDVFQQLARHAVRKAD